MASSSCRWRICERLFIEIDNMLGTCTLTTSAYWKFFLRRKMSSALTVVVVNLQERDLRRLLPMKETVVCRQCFPSMRRSQFVLHQSASASLVPKKALNRREPAWCPCASGHAAEGRLNSCPLVSCQDDAGQRQWDSQRVAVIVTMPGRTCLTEVEIGARMYRVWRNLALVSDAYGVSSAKNNVLAIARGTRPAATSFFARVVASLGLCTNKARNVGMLKLVGPKCARTPWQAARRRALRMMCHRSPSISIGAPPRSKNDGR